MKQYVIEIDNWHPTSVNKLIGRNRFTASRLKQADTQMIGVYAYRAKIPKAKMQRHVSMEIHVAGGGRSPDPDNMYKSVLDALVKTGYLVDDGPLWVALSMPDIIRSKVKKTIITLTDMKKKNVYK